MSTQAHHRFVFVGGLHRSGTSPIARWLGAHPEVSALSDTGVPEDEGQHLQSVYPTAGQQGGAGAFALNPEAHRTETSPLVTDTARASLLESWGRHWDMAKPVLLEKSPPNVISSRFLRALFGDVRFVMVVRHPIAVSLATRRWKPAPNDLGVLVRNWVAAHEIMLEDARGREDLAVVRYEDVMAAPDAWMARLFRFIGLEPQPVRHTVKHGLNDEYFAQWAPLWRPLRRRTAGRLAECHESAVTTFGYSLREPAALSAPAPEVADLAPPDGLP